MEFSLGSMKLGHNDGAKKHEIKQYKNSSFRKAPALLSPPTA